MGMLHPDHLRELSAAKPTAPTESKGFNLGYFDSLVEGHFGHLNDGEVIFYPYGPFGRRGYIVDSPVVEGRLRQRARGLGRWSLLVCAIAAFGASRFIEQIDFVVFLLILAIGWIPDWILARLAYASLTRSMKRASAPNSPIAYWKAMGRTMHPALLLLLAASGLLFTAGGFVLFFWMGDPIGLVIGVLFGALTLPAYGVAIWGRWGT